MNSLIVSNPYDIKLNKLIAKTHHILYWIHTIILCEDTSDK
jgi:hypothetical protein